jgi:hypothetical protein
MIANQQLDRTEGLTVRLRIQLPWGTLKLKHLKYLRTAEQQREVPMWRFSRRYYLIWWPAHRS